VESHDELRQHNRKLRADLDSTQLEIAAAALAEHILPLPEYQQAQRVAVYFAVNGEIGLDAVIDHALVEGKEIFLPNLDHAALRFSPYFRTHASEMLSPQELDLVLAPLVVFDGNRNRIGMGGGFYDRSFAFRKNPEYTRPVLIGVAHEIQKVDRIVPEKWDVQLDMIVTDQAIYK
jgi:5-formyltetrahydrofolate cyclo-ligase